MTSLRIAVAMMLLASSSNAFSPSAILSARTQSTTTSLQMSNNDGNLVVISPPGGIGEVAAVQAAKMGSSVKWFVISPPSSTSSVTLSAETLQSIADDSDGGAVQLAGAQADTILLPLDDAASATGAVSAWCSSATGVICTFDGVEQSIESANSQPGAKVMDGSEFAKTRNVMVDAIKVAAKEASKSAASSGMKVAVLPADMDIDVEGDEEDNGPGLLGSLLGGNRVEVPKTLATAMKTTTAKNVATLRYGDLFGLPESSPDASAFVGGPRKYPVLRDEYTMRSVRIDPTISIAGNAMMGESTRSSRLSVGEAAVRMATKALNVKDGIDVCLTSLRGMETLDNEDWTEEFDRVQKAMEATGGAELFSVEFGSVPSVERLADWVATKWAPAVLKTYDIAGIRVGSRPVYASRLGEGEIEIVWQELKDFKSLVVGKMIIKVTETGITARRAPGDASVGFGSISRKPLAGEDILVRRLSDAATQATEKGLATKPAPMKRRKKQVVEAPVVSTVISSGAVSTPKPAAAQPATSETGPRTSGARRSSERARGKRRKTPPKSQ